MLLTLDDDDPLAFWEETSLLPLLLYPRTDQELLGVPISLAVADRSIEKDRIWVETSGYCTGYMDKGTGFEAYPATVRVETEVAVVVGNAVAVAAVVGIVVVTVVFGSQDHTNELVPFAAYPFLSDVSPLQNSSAHYLNVCPGGCFLPRLRLLSLLVPSTVAHHRQTPIVVFF
jgi:hypothetical protein